MSDYDVLDRIAAANPVPSGPPPQAWTPSVLLDGIDERRAMMTKLEPVRKRPPEDPRRRWRLPVAIAAGAFAVVLLIVGAVALFSGGNEPAEDVVTPSPTTAVPATTTPPPTEAPPPPAADPVDVGRSFIEAMDEADVEAALALFAPNAVFVNDLAESVDDLGPIFEWQTSFGVQWTVRACEQTAAGPPVLVSCEYETQTPMGLAVLAAPVVGSYDYVISDGLIEEITHNFNGLGGWDEFARYMRSHEDFDKMYTDDTAGHARLAPESFALWEEHTARFLADRFYRAFWAADFDSAESMASDSRVLTSQVRFRDVIDAFEVEIIDMSCEVAARDVTVICLATWNDAFGRQVSPDYTALGEGRFIVRDGAVASMTTRNLDDPIFDPYVEYLDENSPDRWSELRCGSGGWASNVECLPLILENVDSWLATDPDLSSIGS